MNTTVRAPPPRRCTWWRTPFATTSAKVRLQRRGQLCARVEVDVVTARQHRELRARDRRGDALAGGQARTAIAVRDERGAADACERVVGNIRLGAQVIEQRALEDEELERLDQTIGLAAPARR